MEEAKVFQCQKREEEAHQFCLQHINSFLITQLSFCFIYFSSYLSYIIYLFQFHSIYVLHLLIYASHSGRLCFRVVLL